MQLILHHAVCVMSLIANMKYLAQFQEILYKRYAVWAYQKVTLLLITFD